MICLLRRLLQHWVLNSERPGTSPCVESRQGHTELAVAIARLAGLVPCTIGAEMLEPEGDGALSVDDAMRYAYEHGVPMITGEEISAAMDEKD